MLFEAHQTKKLLHQTYKQADQYFTYIESNMSRYTKIEWQGAALIFILDFRYFGFGQKGDSHPLLFFILRV